MKDSTRYALDAWVQRGQVPGNFLTAVLSDELFNALRYADSENLRDLHEICSYIYNECPAGCWGSRTTMVEWNRHNGLSGLAA